MCGRAGRGSVLKALIIHEDDRHVFKQTAQGSKGHSVRARLCSDVRVHQRKGPSSHQNALLDLRLCLQGAD